MEPERDWGMRRRWELRSVWGLCVVGIRGSGVGGWTGLRFGGMFGVCEPGDGIIIIGILMGIVGIN